MECDCDMFKIDEILSTVSHFKVYTSFLGMCVLSASTESGAPKKVKLLQGKVIYDCRVYELASFAVAVHVLASEVQRKVLEEF